MTEQTIDVDSLPPTQYLILELLAARQRLGHNAWPFPRSMRSAVDKLVQLGLVNEDSWPTPKTISLSLTEAGREVMLRDGYTPPILQRDPAPQPLDLRALAVILSSGEKAARDMQDPGLAHALWFMVEQTIALHQGPASPIGNLDEEFTELAARFE